MQRIDLAGTISILANLGVIAGIVFLAFELRQNNELMVAQARFNQLSVTTGSANLLIENPDLNELLLRANGGETLAPAEQLRLDNFLYRVFANIEWSFYELPEALYPMGRWSAITRFPALKSYWQKSKTEFSDEFATFMDANFFGP